MQAISPPAGERVSDVGQLVMPPRREGRGFLDRDQAPRTRGVQC
jgi:hypothetical protein